jgi:hypothetical protein
VDGTDYYKLVDDLWKWMSLSVDYAHHISSSMHYVCQRWLSRLDGVESDLTSFDGGEKKRKKIVSGIFSYLQKNRTRNPHKNFMENKKEDQTESN